ncbi:MAG: aminotransferase class V-fold PLP-dependent enzyme [Gemmatimonadetes bacterium]|nr:aminotransferase class V-fold PLP-dependent enzyme [Gemmatimonadota bacterium]
MSPLLREVEEAGIEGMRRKRTPFETAPRDFFEDSDRLRDAFASLIGAPDPERVAIVPSVSYGITTVARNLNPPRGSNVVILAEQFPSNVYPWRRLADERELVLRTVEAPVTAGSRGAAWNEALLEAIDSSTSVVAVPLYHWMDGTRFDLEEVGKRARELGAALVIDGTQSVGAVPFDLSAVQPDALVCAGYKWLLGPYSLGLAWYGSRFDGGVPLEETWTSRPDSDDFRRIGDYRNDYRPGAARYDVGERSNFILVPMQLAAIRRILAWSPEAIQEYCRSITRDALTEAVSLGVTVEDEMWRGNHLFGLRLPAGVDPARLGPELEARSISVSLRGSAIRVAPHVYNGEEDLNTLVEAIRVTLG